MHVRPVTLPPGCARLATSEQSRVLTGYRIRVTVRERSQSGQGLDVGPFLRRIFADARPVSFGERPASFFSFSIDFACFNAARMNFRR